MIIKTTRVYYIYDIFMRLGGQDSITRALNTLLNKFGAEKENVKKVKKNEEMIMLNEVNNNLEDILIMIFCKND